MNSISSSKNGQLLLVIALLMALLFALYYYVVKPKQDDAQSLSREVQQLATEITLLEQTLATAKSEQAQHSGNEFALRQKVPDNRAIDALILTVEEIEYVTGTRIQSIEFNNYDALVLESGLQDPATFSETEEQQSMGGATETIEASEERSERPVSTISADTLPASLKLVTFSVRLAAQDESDVLRFVQEVEKVARVMHIDAIDFDIPGEADALAEGGTEIVTAEVLITAFYYE